MTGTIYGDNFDVSWKLMIRAFQKCILTTLWSIVFARVTKTDHTPPPPLICFSVTSGFCWFTCPVNTLPPPSPRNVFLKSTVVIMWYQVCTKRCFMRYLDRSIPTYYFSATRRNWSGHYTLSNNINHSWDTEIYPKPIWVYLTKRSWMGYLKPWYGIIPISHGWSLEKYFIQTIERQFQLK